MKNIIKPIISIIVTIIIFVTSYYIGNAISYNELSTRSDKYMNTLLGIPILIIFCVIVFVVYFIITEFTEN